MKTIPLKDSEGNLLLWNRYLTAIKRGSKPEQVWISLSFSIEETAHLKKMLESEALKPETLETAILNHFSFKREEKGINKLEKAIKQIDGGLKEEANRGVFVSKEALRDRIVLLTYTGKLNKTEKEKLLTHFIG